MRAVAETGCGGTIGAKVRTRIEAISDRASPKLLASRASSRLNTSMDWSVISIRSSAVSRATRLRMLV